MAIFLETELPMVGDLHRLIHEQVPRVSAMPMRCPQKASMGDEKQIAGFIAVIEIPGDPVRDLVVGPRLVTIVLIRSLTVGKRARASAWDCLHNAMVGWMKALFTLRGMRSQAKVVAARVLPEPVGPAHVQKCGTEILHR